MGALSGGWNWMMDVSVWGQVEWSFMQWRESSCEESGIKRTTFLPFRSFEKLKVSHTIISSHLFASDDPLCSIYTVPSIDYHDPMVIEDTGGPTSFESSNSLIYRVNSDELK